MSDLFQEPEYVEGEVVASTVEVAQPLPVALTTVDQRLEHIEAQNAQIIDGLNTIGSMLNGFAESFGEVMKMVESGGVGALFGGLLGRKN